MKILSDFGKGLDTLSSEIQAVPSWVYLTAVILILSCLVFYGLVIPRLHIPSEKKIFWRRACVWGLTVIYMVCVLLITILTRESSELYRMNLAPLNGFRDFDHINRELIRDGANLLLFVPLGIGFAWQHGKKRIFLHSLGFSFGFSLAVELFQLGGKFGIFDVDDLIFNTLGGLLGAVLVWIWRKAFRKKRAYLIAVRVALVFLLVLVVGAGGAFGAYHYLRTSGAEKLQGNVSTVALSMESREEGTIPANRETDLIYHNGKAYRFNEEMITLLFMGIDQRSEEVEQILGISGESGQADTIFLVAMNPLNDKIKVIAVSRDTMTEIPIFDARGNYLGEEKNHLGLAYAFGDGREKSCQYMVDAVSRLFYGIPINGYAAFNMSAIATINDAVGGVTVTVPEDLSSVDPLLTKGATVTLKGNSAFYFAKWRNTAIHDSNTLRMNRQKIYLENFFKQAVKAVQKDYTLQATLYQELSQQMVTDISLDKAVYLSTEALNMTFGGEDLIALKGTAVQGSVYDEYKVDDDALYELILDVFYIEQEVKK